MFIYVMLFLHYVDSGVYENGQDISQMLGTFLHLINKMFKELAIYLTDVPTTSKISIPGSIKQQAEVGKR